MMCTKWLDDFASMLTACSLQFYFRKNEQTKTKGVHGSGVATVVLRNLGMFMVGTKG